MARAASLSALRRYTATGIFCTRFSVERGEEARATRKPRTRLARRGARPGSADEQLRAIRAGDKIKEKAAPWTRTASGLSPGSADKPEPAASAGKKPEQNESPERDLRAEALDSEPPTNSCAPPARAIRQKKKLNLGRGLRPGSVREALTNRNPPQARGKSRSKTKAPNATCASRLSLVPLTGVEPVRCLHRGILSPLCLPIPP